MKSFRIEYIILRSEVWNVRIPNWTCGVGKKSPGDNSKLFIPLRYNSFSGGINGRRIYMNNQKSTTGNVALLCAAVIGITNIYVAPIYDGTSGFMVLFVLMVLTGLAVPAIYMIPGRAVKFAAYIFLGFSAYWAVGAAMNLVHTGELFDSFQFLPMVIFAMANAVVILIAIVDSPRYGYGFAGMGLAVMIYNVTRTWNLDYVGGKPDMLLLTFVLCSLIPLLWCYLLAGTVRSLRFSAANRFYATLKAGILTLSVFIILAATIAISQLSLIDELSEVGEFLSITSGDLLILCWYYLLSHVVFVMVVFFANHLVLNAFDIEKTITEDGEVIYRRLAAEDDEETEEGLENPYNSIVKEMKNFQSEFKKGKLNRLACVQEVGKFRNELDLLVSKYDYGSRDDAEEMLHQIEKNVEFSFK